MLVKELLSPAECVIPQASKIYDNLLNYVNRRFHDNPEETRAVVLALAYSKYCREKKAQINENCKVPPTTPAARKQQDNNIAVIIRNLDNERHFEDWCNEATELFAALAKKTKDEIGSAIAAEMSAIVQPITAGLKDVSNAVAKEPPKKWYESSFHFVVVKCPLYALQIVIATLWLLLVVVFVNLVQPGAINHVKGVIRHELDGLPEPGADHPG